MKQIQLDDASLSEFFEQLALLMHSGILFSDSLRIISEKENTKEFNGLLLNLANDLDSGTPIADAFENSNVFSSHTVGFLRTGEQTGRLEETLYSLAHYHGTKDRRKKKLTDALTYPSVLLLLMVVIIVVLLTQVLPIFNDVYSSLGGSLSGIAKGLFALGNALNVALPYIGIAIGIILIAAATVFLLSPLRKKIAAGLEPLFGGLGISRKMNDSAFAQALAVAVNSGLTFEEGITLASSIFNDKPGTKKRYKKCAELIENGTSLDEALKECKIFSSSSAYMLKLGMNAGRGDETIQDIANRMTEEAEDSVNEALAKIEPALVIATSLITGVILLTVMLPLIDIMKTIG